MINCDLSEVLWKRDSEASLAKVADRLGAHALSDLGGDESFLPDSIWSGTRGRSSGCAITR